MNEDRRIFWAKKFVECGAALKGYFRRRVAHAEDAEDLAQEVYLRLLRVDGGEAARIANPEAYLYTVATNLLRERALMRQRRPGNIGIDDLTMELVSPDLTPEEQASKTERNQCLADVVNDLSPKFKATIVMHFGHDLTYEEIAAKLNVTSHAVKKNISRGLQACRRKMNRLG